MEIMAWHIITYAHELFIIYIVNSESITYLFNQTGCIFSTVNMSKKIVLVRCKQCF